MKRIGIKQIAVLVVLLGLPTAFLFEALSSRERVLVGADPLLAHPPWIEPGRAPANPELSDQAIVFVPYYDYLREELNSRGSLPGWNPYQFCGSPAVGNPQFGHFDVFALGLHQSCFWVSNLFGEARSSYVAYEIGAWLRLLIGAAFTYLLARRLLLSRPAGLLAGLAFGYGGFQVLWLNWPLGHVSTFLPVVIYFLDRGMRERRPLSLALAALSFALAILAGHPETAFFIGLFAGVWTLSVGRSMRREGAGIRPLLGGLLALVAGTAMGSALLLPFLEYLGQSATMDMRADRHAASGEGLGAHLALHLGLLLEALCLVGCVAAVRIMQRFWQLVFFGLLGGAMAYFLIASAADQMEFLPQFLVDSQWMGDPREGNYFGPAAYLEANKSYVGVLALVLALVGALTPARRSLPAFGAVALFAALDLIGLLGLPPFARLLHALPPFSWIELSRFAAVGTLCLALLAGRGLDRILVARGGDPGERRILAFPIAVLAALGALLWLAPPSQEFRGATGDPAIAAGDAGLGEVLAPSDGFRSRSRTLEVCARIRGPVETATVELVPLDGSDGVLRSKMRRIESGAATASESEAARYRATISARLFAGSYRVRIAVQCAGEAAKRAIHGGVVHLCVQSGPLSARSRMLLIAAGLWLLVALVGMGVVGRRVAWFGPLLGLLAAGLVAVDLWNFGRGYDTTCEKDWIYHQTPALRFLEGQLRDARAAGRGEFRIWAASGVLPGNCATGVRLRDVRGYDAIEMAHWQLFYSYWLSEPLLRESVPEAIVSEAALNLRNCPVEAPLFRALGVRYVLDTQRLSDREQALRGLRLVFPGGGARAPLSDGVFVYELVESTGMRAFLARGAVDEVTATGLRLRGEVPFLEAPEQCAQLAGQPGSIAPLDPPAKGGTLRFLRDEPDHIEIAVEELDGEAWLVLMDSDYPGWRARVDGAEVPIRRAFLAFRAIRLPAGARRVEFSYEPESLRRALAPSLGGLALVLALVVASLLSLRGSRGSARRRARPCSPSPPR